MRSIGTLAALLIAVTALLALLFFGPWREARIVPPPTDPAGLTDLPASSIGVSLTLHPDQVLHTLEASVPLRLGDMADRRTYPADTLATYAFLAEREPFITEVQGDTIHVSTVIQYGAQVWYDTPFGLQLTASCGISEANTLGAGAPRAVVGFSSPLGIDAEWRVRSAVRLDRVAPLTVDDRCVVTLLQFEMDVTEAILFAAEEWLQEQAAQMDQAMAAYSFDAHLDGYWEELRHPIHLTEDVWFALNPERIRPAESEAARAGGGGAHLGAEITVTARPRIILGTPPPSESPGAGPPEGWLRDSEEAETESPAGSEPAAPFPDAWIEWQAPYATLSALLTEWMREGDLQFLGRPVEISGVEVTSLGDGRMDFGFDLTAPIRGRIHLSGTPVIDPATGELVLADLGVRVTSGSLPTRMAIWFVDNVFPNRIRNRARWPIEDLLAGAREFAELGLNRRVTTELAIEGSLGPMEPIEIGATPDALVLRTAMEMDVRLVIGEDPTGDR